MEFISTDSEFFKFIEEVSAEPYNVFRGVSSEKYLLIPKIGRHHVTRTEPPKDFDEVEEKLIIDLFAQKAYPYLKNKPEKYIELMVIAQHYGVPTRLLDWTYNPLVAAFFAIERESKDDSLIYITRLPEINELNIKMDFDPFKIETPNFYFPDHYTERIKAQVGLFTVSPRPYEPLKLGNVKTVIIKNDYRRKLKYLLYILGIHYASIYPDIEGVGKHIYWLRTNVY